MLDALSVSDVHVNHADLRNDIYLSDKSAIYYKELRGIRRIINLRRFMNIFLMNVL